MHIRGDEVMQGPSRGSGKSSVRRAPGEGSGQAFGTAAQETKAVRRARTPRQVREAERRAALLDHWSLLLAFYCANILLLFYDLVPKAHALDFWPFPPIWLWAPVLGIGTPLILYAMWRNHLSAGPWIAALGICGFIVCLMDVGGLTVRRFMLWYVWLPPMALFLTYWICTKPRRDAERTAAAKRKPLSSHIRHDDPQRKDRGVPG